MNLSTTLLFYLLLGVAVGVAVHLSADVIGPRERLFRTVFAVVFWPLFVPALLPGSPVRGECLEASPVQPPSDELGRAIQQVEAELDLALASLNGWPDAVLAREQHRFEELRTAWRGQAEKIRELDLLLGKPAFDSDGTPSESMTLDGRAAQCECGRRENVARLKQLRQRMEQDLLNTLAGVRELVTMIHLARYTGAPASRAEELLAQIATSIEGLSEVAGWRETESVGSA